MKRLLALTTTALALALAPPASAGTYDVKACFTDPGGGPAVNASWVADTPFTPYVATYTACPGEGIVTRMSGGTGSAPYGASARHAFTAPPGTRIVHFRGNLRFDSARGWYAGFVDSSPRWVWCGAGCTSFGQYWGTDFATNTPQLFAQVTCGSGSGCPRASQDGIIAMRDVVVTVADDVAPGVAITGGSVTAPGWHSGNQHVQFSASDATGISAVEVIAGGAQRGLVSGRCSYVQSRPCLDESGNLSIPAESFSVDGRHIVTIRAHDAARNASESSQSVLVDRTPPAQALDVRVDGGDGWRAVNRASLRWRNPPQHAAPIAAAHYSICPTSNPAGDQRGCIDGVRGANEISSIVDLSVPRPGEWRLSLWLEDQAGNADRERATPAGVIRFDADPPAVSIAAQRVDDPTLVHAIASDAHSGIESGQIEARRRGEEAWRALPTTLVKGGFSARLDDGSLPKGQYELRARAVDFAGNERSTESQTDGQAATRTLPLRISTRLAVGRPQRVRARGAGGKRKYRTVLRVRSQTRFGGTIPLRGRLTMPGGNPLAGADVEVWENVKLSAAPWRRVGVVRTTRAGRFRFKALRGPSRTLSFRYLGTETIRPRSKQVELGVQAMTSIRSNRRTVVNGEEIRFHGRLRGRQTLDMGKLLHLQVYSRGRWATFATPRANRSSGLWSQPYRFTATRGLVRYRFRALIPREASFPYETGTSRSVMVTVRGL
jgi:hypothetical protein